jgi:hypothetical protein
MKAALRQQRRSIELALSHGLATMVAQPGIRNMTGMVAWKRQVYVRIDGWCGAKRLYCCSAVANLAYGGMAK